MTFDQFGLGPRVLAGVKRAGFTHPTPIQRQAIPLAIEGRDVIGLAQTGTGKTAAFLLPIHQRLLSAAEAHSNGNGKARHVRVLVVAPTRELAEQIHQTSVELGRNTGLQSVSIYGGVSKGTQAVAIRRGVDIVVACPGRLLDHMGDGNIDLSRVEVLVLDEADRMCDMGFLPDIRRILERLPKQRQTLFYSATMPKDIRRLADQILDDPITVQVDANAPAKTVSHALYPVSQQSKKALLLEMLQRTRTGRVLVFTRTKHRARTLARDLDKSNYRASALQGNMTQNRRQQAIDGFRDGSIDILVATDIAARGIDVEDISHVINFDMPDTVDAYTHRIGRTGRAHQSGEAVTFAVHDDAALVRDIERVLGAPIERRKMDGFDHGPDLPDGPSRNGNGGGSRPSRNQSDRRGATNGKHVGGRNGQASRSFASDKGRAGNSSPAAESRPTRPTRQGAHGGTAVDGGSKAVDGGRKAADGGGRAVRSGGRARRRGRRNPSGRQT